MTVDYETRDGSARAGSNYQAASGTVKLNEGNGFQQTVEITVNAHDVCC